MRAHYDFPPPLRRRVDDPRNSRSVLPIKQLNFRKWWTDNTGGGLYLHVEHQDGERVSRVRCRLTDSPRLFQDKGVLYWLIEPARIRETSDLNT